MASPTKAAFAADPIPPRAGLGLREPHVRAFLDSPPPEVAWIEVHSENYLAPGGPRLAALERIRRDRPLSCHGVGLSLGSAEGLDRDHLARLRALFDRLEPGLVSEHLAWSVVDGVYLDDLLPLPYTEEALAVLSRNVDQAQTALGRRLLVENPARYVAFAAGGIAETDFLAALTRRTGCGILLDVNNLHVSARNLGFEPLPWLDALPGEAVGEIHIAGHARRRAGGGTVLIDEHGSPVAGPVWRLLEHALGGLGPLPVLLERDANIPPLGDLLAEVERAAAIIDRAARGGLGRVA